MTDRNANSRARLPTRMVSAALAMSGCLFVSGCVSAVDDTSSFGFSPGANAQRPGGDADQVADLIKADGAPDASAPTAAPTEANVDNKESQVAAAGEGTLAERIAGVDPATPPPAAPRQVAALAAGNEGGIAPTGLMRRASNPAVAAFAERDAGTRQADSSLYASLYNESTARTPIRNADREKSRRVIVMQTEGIDRKPGDDALPGVDPKSLFEIGQRASADSDLLDDIGGSYQIASLSGIARLAPSGLLIQREDIVTNCFKSDLLGLISQIEQRFKQKVVITSGYRSPAHNKRVNGAKASMHMACKAADLHVPGVNGVTVANFVRNLPGRGGVGTYCHTAAIHIDVGPMRDWNWACRQRRTR